VVLRGICGGVGGARRRCGLGEARFGLVGRGRRVRVSSRRSRSPAASTTALSARARVPVDFGGAHVSRGRFAGASMSSPPRI
jgi:hypothetical protein